MDLEKPAATSYSKGLSTQNYINILSPAVFNAIKKSTHLKYFKYSIGAWEIKHSMNVFTQVLIRALFRANRLRIYTSVSLW